MSRGLGKETLPELTAEYVKLERRLATLVEANPGLCPERLALLIDPTAEVRQLWFERKGKEWVGVLLEPHGGSCVEYLAAQPPARVRGLFFNARAALPADIELILRHGYVQRRGHWFPSALRREATP